MNKSIFLPIMALAAFVAAFSLSSNHLAQSADMKSIPLEQIPEISPVVLEQQDKQVRIANPVPCLSKVDYWFTVEVLPSKRFPEAELYEFAGDAERLEHFVREIQFVNADKAGLGSLAIEAGDGAVEDIKEMISALWKMVRHPIDTAGALKNGMGSLLICTGKLVQGKEDIVADFARFWAAYKENAKTRLAAEHGLSYQELQTAPAFRDVGALTKSNVTGRGVVEVATMLLAWTKLGKAGKAAEATQAATKADQAAQSSTKLTKVGNAGALFEMAAKAEQGAARTAKFAAIGERMSNLEKLANLLDPSKVATLKGNRALNARLHKVLYWIRQEELAGRNPNEALWRAMKTAKADAPNLPSMLNGKVDSARLMKNYDLAKEMKVFDRAENLDLMRRGQSPLIATPSGLEKIEVDHIIPVSHAPELENAWGNLAYQTKRLNQARGDKFIPSMGDKLLEYHDAGMLPQKRVDEILMKSRGLTSVGK